MNLSEYAYERGKGMVRNMCDNREIVNWMGVMFYKGGPAYRHMFGINDGFRKEMVSHLEKPIPGIEDGK